MMYTPLPLRAPLPLPRLPAISGRWAVYFILYTLYTRHLRQVGGPQPGLEMQGVQVQPVAAQPAVPVAVAMPVN